MLSPEGFPVPLPSYVMLHTLHYIKRPRQHPLIYVRRGGGGTISLLKDCQEEMCRALLFFWGPSPFLPTSLASLLLHIFQGERGALLQSDKGTEHKVRTHRVGVSLHHRTLLSFTYTWEFATATAARRHPIR